MEPTEELLDRAVQHHDSGELEVAAPLYERVLRLDPGHPGALYRLGALELQRSNVSVSVELLKKAVQMRPDLAEVHNALGVACKAMGQWGAAAESFERALQVNPNFSEAFFNLGDLSQTLGQTDRAIEFYLQSIKLYPHDAEPFLRLGDLLFAREIWAGAEQCLRRVLDIAGICIAPSCGHDHGPAQSHQGIAAGQTELELLSRLGIACLKQEKLDDAAAVFQRILDFDPNLAEMHSNLAYVYERQGKLDQAVAEGELATRLRPNYAEGHNNLGVAYRALHRLDAARTSFARAMELKSDFPLARFNLGTVDLMEGDYPAGWKGYEARLATLPQTPRQFAIQRWDGKKISSRAPHEAPTLLVHAEQGYGDTIQFARFLPLAKDRSEATIVVEAPAGLVPLLQGAPGVDLVVAAGSRGPTTSAEVPLPSLPGLLGVTLADLPTAVGYLSVPKAYREKWEPRIREMSEALANRSGAAGARQLRVGIAWRGNPAQSQNVVRSCPLSEMARLTNAKNILWFSLQHDATPEEIGATWPTEVSIAALGADLADFADTAAAMEQLDLVITVDTSVAHLAGALAIPCWTLLCRTPDWRWQLDRPGTPWYPGMKLFRQPGWGDWREVIDQVTRQLALVAK